MKITMVELAMYSATCALFGATVMCIIQTWRARAARGRAEIETSRKIAEYQLEALHLGRAQGEIVGQSNAFAAIEGQVRDRGEKFGEVTFEDVERARRGVLH